MSQGNPIHAIPPVSLMMNFNIFTFLIVFQNGVFRAVSHRNPPCLSPLPCTVRATFPRVSFPFTGSRSSSMRGTPHHHQPHVTYVRGLKNTASRYDFIVIAECTYSGHLPADVCISVYLTILYTRQAVRCTEFV